MESNYKTAEQTILDEIAADISAADAHGHLYDFEDKWAEYATAFALHRLANAWERRVEIAKATARQKGINP